MTAWVGLTGGIGSGKSQVAAYFAELDVPIIDADTINRQIISQLHHIALQAIKQQFGDAALNVSGSLNRDYMRQLIFNQPEKKRQLEAILHPHIMQGIQTMQQHTQAIYGMIELPTLKPHSPFLTLLNRVLVIQSDEQERIARIQKRNGFDESSIRAIIQNQISDAERLSMADDVLHNNGDLKQLSEQVKKQHQIYLQLFADNKDLTHAPF